MRWPALGILFVPPGEDRPRLACEAAEAWVAAPSQAAGNAAWTAGYAARDAGEPAGAAGETARSAEHKKLCDLIRAEIARPEFATLTWPIK